MSKKSFKGAGMEAVIPTKPRPVEAEKRPRGRPKSNFKIPKSASDTGTKPGETRASFIMSEDLLEGIKAIAHYNSTTIKDVLEAALKKFLDSRKELPNALDRYRNRKPFS